MAIAQTQIRPSHTMLGGLASSLTRTVNALVGNQHLLAEFSATAAHYDGLIDMIERAGWDLSKVEKVKHAFDDTAKALLRELTDSLPDMSEPEEQSFLAPYHHALHQIARMTEKEKLAFRTEYGRFSQLQAQSLEQFATDETA